MSLRILKEGLFSSLQGPGEYGLQRFGINPRGAMDRSAVRLLNTLLRNEDDDSVIELHFPAGEIEFEETADFAIGGADFAVELSGKPLSLWRDYKADPNDILRFTEKRWGARCYLALAGGLRSSTIPEERYTTLRLQRSERILRIRVLGPPGRPSGAISPQIIPSYQHNPVVRFVAGSEYGLLSVESRVLLEGGAFTVSPTSNRMGYRLQGPPLRLMDDVELISASVTFGTIQMLPDGQLIVLMADHQTTGGYPRLGNVISVDLPLLAQLSAGESCTFRQVEIAEAEEAIDYFEASIKMLKTTVAFGRYW